MTERGLFIVMAKVKPEQEQAFNTWYDEDHLPKALNRFPGVISGRRYKVQDGGEGYNYMAQYEFESREKLNEAMGSGALKGLIKEFDETFGDIDRKRITAVQTLSLVKG